MVALASRSSESLNEHGSDNSTFWFRAERLALLRMNVSCTRYCSIAIRADAPFRPTLKRVWNTMAMNTDNWRIGLTQASSGLKKWSIYSILKFVDNKHNHDSSYL